MVRMVAPCYVSVNVIARRVLCIMRSPSSELSEVTAVRTSSLPYVVIYTQGVRPPRRPKEEQRMSAPAMNLQVSLMVAALPDDRFEAIKLCYRETGEMAGILWTQGRPAGSRLFA